MEKKQQVDGEVKYERPEVTDLGTLRELTEGGTRRGFQDQLFPNSPRAVKGIFS